MRYTTMPTVIIHLHTAVVEAAYQLNEQKKLVYVRTAEPLVPHIEHFLCGAEICLYVMKFSVTTT